MKMGIAADTTIHSACSNFESCSTDTHHEI
jgi:hypothetical protein